MSPPSYPNALRRAQTSSTPLGTEPVRIPLLVVIFTQRENEARRAWQRSTWLQQRWTRGELRQASTANATRTSGAKPAAWRYVYVMARSAASDADEHQVLDQVRGDAVTLSAVRESYANLVYKTLEAVRWSLNHVAFGALLKTDDDSIVHIGRASAWLQHVQLRPSRGRRSSSQNILGRGTLKGGLASLYAGHVFNDSQVIRANYTRRELMHPEWFPADFTKWAIPYESYDCMMPHSLATPCYYPPYCSGGGYFLGAAAARRIVRAYDVRRAAKRPVVRVEDAYVGILAAESGVVALNVAELVEDPPPGRAHSPALYGGKVIVHRVQEPRQAFEWLVYPVTTAFEGSGGGGGGSGGKKKGAGAGRGHRRRMLGS